MEWISIIEWVFGQNTVKTLFSGKSPLFKKFTLEVLINSGQWNNLLWLFSIKPSFHQFVIFCTCSSNVSFSTKKHHKEVRLVESLFGHELLVRVPGGHWSACITGHDDRGRLMRRTIMRYLNLSFILTMRLVCLPVKKRFPTLEHLVDAGILQKVRLLCLELKN